MQHLFETLGTPPEMELVSLPSKAAREYFSSIAKVNVELEKDLDSIYSRHRDMHLAHAAASDSAALARHDSRLRHQFNSGNVPTYRQINLHKHVTGIRRKL